MASVFLNPRIIDVQNISPFFRRLARRRGGVTASLLHLDLHIEFAACGEVRDHVIGIHNLDVVDLLDVTGGHHALARLPQREHGFFAAVHFQHDAFQVKQYVHNIFLDAVNSRVLVQHARDPHLGRGTSGHRGQERAP